MKFFLNLSYRYKIPMWGGFLIIIAALAVSASFMLNAYKQLENELAVESEKMGHALQSSLFSALLQDDVWRAFEIISEASHRTSSNRVRVEQILVVDPSLRVIVSTQPRVAPMLSELKGLDSEFSELSNIINNLNSDQSKTVELRHSKHYYALTVVSGNFANTVV